VLTLNLAKIRTAHERFDRTYQPEVFAEDRETFTVIEPVQLGFDLHKDHDLFHLIGQVQTALELSCSRCLEPFRVPVDVAFDLRYQPRRAATDAGEREVQEDDFTTAFYDDEAIDLGQLMRERLYLAVPMKPLCADGCRGLCPQCGANWNKVSCACAQDWEDPRFSALRTLRDNAPGNH
jgi:uncharacterized protein